MTTKRIVLTGGGTAGHVTPNLALIPALQRAGYEIHYIGSYNGIEKRLIEGAGIPYDGISSGKLRRYFDWKNFSDPFRVLRGYLQAVRLLRRYKPDIIFSKGGFVAVPVVLAAGRRKIPVVIHESDMTPGLANRICMRYANAICCNFPETLKSLPADRAVLTGSPIRPELLTGDAASGLSYAGLDHSRPVILVIGGSLGSIAVNQAVRAILPKLLKSFQVIHICGKGNLDDSLLHLDGYRQFEYVDQPLRHLFAAADMMISRAGANSICEILALHKPNLLIPLSAAASRGDQILNANSFRAQGYSTVLQEENLSEENLMTAIENTWNNREQAVRAMSQSHQKDAISLILELLEKYRKR